MSTSTAPQAPTPQAEARARDERVLGALRLHTCPGGPLAPVQLAAHLPGLAAGEVGGLSAAPGPARRRPPTPGARWVP